MKKFLRGSSETRWRGRTWAVRSVLAGTLTLLCTGCAGYVGAGYGEPYSYYDYPAYGYPDYYGGFYDTYPDYYVFGGGPYYHHFDHDFSHRGWESRGGWGGRGYAHAGGFHGVARGGGHGYGGGGHGGGGHGGGHR